jgi:hypothetical protein
MQFTTVLHATVCYAHRSIVSEVSCPGAAAAGSSSCVTGVNREFSTRDSDPVGVKHSAMCGTGSSKLSAACSPKHSAVYVYTRGNKKC